MSNTSIALSDHWRKFIDEQVARGRYGSASEVVREGLRLAEERQKRIDALDQAITDGLASGPPEPFDMDRFLRRKRQDWSKLAK